MKIHQIFALLTVCLLFFNQQLSAQNFYKEHIPRDYYYQAGLGLGIMYADNAGRFRALDVKFNPSLSLTIGRKLNNLIDLRAYLGYQHTRSQDMNYFNSQVTDLWKETQQAIMNQGNGVYVDLMPTLHLFKNNNHTFRKTIDLYGGAGLGLLMHFNKETKIINENLALENKTKIEGYVPIRGGISYKLGLNADIALEGTLMLTFSDELDGNKGFNRFNDHLLNGQIVYRRYLSNIKPTY
ncbi:MAG: hypothetical protein WD398_05930 [Cyclobacteriaceae bacterium]